MAEIRVDHMWMHCQRGVKYLITCVIIIPHFLAYTYFTLVNVEYLPKSDNTLLQLSRQHNDHN